MADGVPATWHYGLVARWWAEFNVETPELDLFLPYLAVGQPALDLACGTGRLLVPLLQAGLEVDGCDVSADMVALCRERVEREGLDTNLYAQAMHELDLPRRYRTILVCGGLGLGGRREHDREALRRIHDHLEPGGLLVLDNEVPYASNSWARWPTDQRDDLPEPWRDYRERERASDGSELALTGRLVALDPLAQHLTREIRAAMWRDGKLVAEESHRLDMTLYFTHEVELMLRLAGFENVETRAGYEERAPAAEDEFVVFLARKSS